MEPSLDFYSDVAAPRPKSSPSLHYLLHSLSLSLSRATMATAASSLTIASSFSEHRTRIHSLKCSNLPYKASSRSKRLVVSSVSSPKVELRTGPDDLISSLLSKVANSDGGVTLTPEQHKEVAQVAGELQKYCVSEPVKCPLIFGGKK